MPLPHEVWQWSRAMWALGSSGLKKWNEEDWVVFASVGIRPALRAMSGRRKRVGEHT